MQFKTHLKLWWFCYFPLTFLEALASLEPVLSHTHSVTPSLRHSLTPSRFCFSRSIQGKFKVLYRFFQVSFKDLSKFFQSFFKDLSKLLQSSKFCQIFLKVYFQVFSTFLEALASLEPVQSHTHSLTHWLTPLHFCPFKVNSRLVQGSFKVLSRFFQSSFKVLSKFFQCSFQVLSKFFQSSFKVCS